MADKDSSSLNAAGAASMEPVDHGGVKLPLWFMIAVFLIPSVETCVSIALAIVPHITYFVLKALSIIVPVMIWRKRRWGWRQLKERFAIRPTKAVWGIVTGLVIFGFIVGGYHLYIGKLLDPAPMIEHVQKLKLDTPLRYLLMSIFISLMNAGYEELFFRGFVFDELRMRLSPKLVVVVGAFIFGLHHVFALFPMFPPLLATIFTLGTMAGGAIWSFMRIKGVSIWDCYISHIAADAAIFLLGWDLMVRGGAA